MYDLASRSLFGPLHLPGHPATLDAVVKRDARFVVNLGTGERFYCVFTGRLRDSAAGTIKHAGCGTET
jgi:hypothetical protein